MIEGVYGPGKNPEAEDQVRLYEGSDGIQGYAPFGVPCVILTSKGAKSGLIRKSPLIRVEHEGVYAVVASRRGKPMNPAWYYNLFADPLCRLQDGSQISDRIAREVKGDEKATWWARAVQVWPDYDRYQTGTSRVIPVLVLESA